ncbi:MAG TPA: zinc dependent phospholipase C family protein [Longimicrobium sp.]|jgi:hypothetical protein
MPKPGSHITIVQRLALSENAPPGSKKTLRALLGNPDPGAQVSAEESRRARYANLGAVGPDMFYFMGDINPEIQQLQNFLVQFHSITGCVGEFVDAIGADIDAVKKEVPCGELVDQIIAPVKEHVSLLLGTLGNLALVVGKEASSFNPYSVFELKRQKDQPPTTWFWADYLHYVRSGRFVAALLARARTDPKYKDRPGLYAYALGYLTHYVTDTVGHPYVNQVVQAPYRLYWQRHALVENFIDAYVWDQWHAPQAGELKKDMPLDKIEAKPHGDVGKGAPFTFSRLHRLVKVGTVSGPDPLDQLVEGFCDVLGQGAQALGMTALFPQLAKHLAEDEAKDADFKLWTELLKDSLNDCYGSIPRPKGLVNPQNPSGIPRPDDIASAYATMRFFLRLATQVSVREPEFPNIAGDVQKTLEKIYDAVEEELKKIPDPPVGSPGGKPSLKNLLKSLRKMLEWLVEAATRVVKAALRALEELCKGAGVIAADVVKAALYIPAKAVWALYQALREVLVLSAYAEPFTGDLFAQLGSSNAVFFWASLGNEPRPETVDTDNTGAGIKPGPVQEFVDGKGKVPQAELFSDYEPSVPPIELWNVREPPTVKWIAPYRHGDLPDAFIGDIDAKLDGKDDMFSPGGPVPHDKTQLTYDPASEHRRNFGGALENCVKAIGLVEKILATPGLTTQQAAEKLRAVLPDYNLDGDRGYAWPCWQVDKGTTLHPTKNLDKPRKVRPFEETL